MLLSILLLNMFNFHLQQHTHSNKSRLTGNEGRAVFRAYTHKQKACYCALCCSHAHLMHDWFFCLRTHTNVNTGIDTTKDAPISHTVLTKCKVTSNLSVHNESKNPMWRRILDQFRTRRRNQVLPEWGSFIRRLSSWILIS